MKTVIFDMDGVIFDSENLVKKCWEIVGSRIGIERLDEIFYDCLGTNKTATRKILDDFYKGALDIDAFFVATREEFWKYVDTYGIPKKPYIEELLVALHKSGYKVGLASSTRYEAVVDELRVAGLLSYFDEIIGGDMVKISKPDPEIFLKCCEGLSGTPSETYVIEDSYNGIRAAHAAGMIPIMVPDMVGPDEEMSKKAKYILEDLGSVKKLLCE